jgi:hypothetical protein
LSASSISPGFFAGHVLWLQGMGGAVDTCSALIMMGAMIACFRLRISAIPMIVAAHRLLFCRRRYGRECPYRGRHQSFRAQAVDNLWLVSIMRASSGG